MEVRAVSKYVRVSAQKARLVADMVRGKKLAEALILLRFTTKKSGRFINKTLRSALANAESSKSMDVDNLFVKTIMIDDGPRQKRWRPRSMGRATQIIKHTSHITVVLSER